MNIFVMVAISLAAGLMSTMNVWVDKFSDMRWNLNDVYMAFLMTGWMLLFTGMYEKNLNLTIVGVVMTIMAFACIRTQFGINSKQYINSMIPHHAMAVFMSEKLLNRNDVDSKLKLFAKAVAVTQKKEIDILKNA